MATARFGQRRRGRGRATAGVVAAVGGAAVVALAVAGGVGGGVGPGEAGLAMSEGAAERAVHVHLGRPTHVYDGTCDELGEVAHALNPVGAGTMTGAAMADVPAMAIGDTIGSPKAAPVETGRTTLAVPIADLVGDRQAVNVYRSEGEYGLTVACGAVGGPIVDGRVAFGLGERNGSGISGLVLFIDQGDATEVVTYLTGGAGAGPDGA